MRSPRPVVSGRYLSARLRTGSQAGRCSRAGTRQPPPRCGLARRRPVPVQPATLIGPSSAAIPPALRGNRRRSRPIRPAAVSASREQLLSQPDVARAGRCRQEFAIGHLPQHERQPDLVIISRHLDHCPSVPASPGCRRDRVQIALGVRGSSARPIGSLAVSGSSSSACSRVAITPDTRRLVSLLQCPRPEVDRTNRDPVQRPGWGAGRRNSANAAASATGKVTGPAGGDRQGLCAPSTVRQPDG